MKILNPSVISALESGEKLKLNIGGGVKSMPGYFNVDLVELPQVDILANLNEAFSLIPDNSVERIYSSHTLEHIENILGLMEELYRICCPDAEIEIIVPHFSNPLYYSDPTHVRPWGIHTISYFMDLEDQVYRKVPCYYTKARFLLRTRRINFSRSGLVDRLLVPVISGAMNRWFRIMDMYERRWCWIYPAWDMRLIVSPKK